MDKESGDKQEKTQWHRVVIFNEPLINNVIAKYLHEGSRVHLEGHLETRKWQDREGTERYSTEIVLRAFRVELSPLDAPKAPGRPQLVKKFSGTAGRPKPA